jgi:hypothetical protein
MRIRLSKAVSLDDNPDNLIRGDRMIKEDQVGRRHFLKTTTLASMAGTYTNALRDAMLRMNVNIIGPSNRSAPDA